VGSLELLWPWNGDSLKNRKKIAFCLIWSLFSYPTTYIESWLYDMNPFILPYSFNLLYTLSCSCLNPAYPTYMYPHPAHSSPFDNLTLSGICSLITLILSLILILGDDILAWSCSVTDSYVLLGLHTLQANLNDVLIRLWPEEDRHSPIETSLKFACAVWSPTTTLLLFEIFTYSYPPSITLTLTQIVEEVEEVGGWRGG